MKKINKWSTLVSTIVSVVIMSICFLTIYKLLDFDNQNSYDFYRLNYINILSYNSDKIMDSSIKTTIFSTWDLVYIKNDWTNITIFTWSVNENYKYINYLWQNIDIQNYKWVYFSRYCKINSFYKDKYLYNCYVE